MRLDNYLENKNVNNKVDIAFDLGNLITEARLYAGITQKDLAERVGTKQPSIARFESGDVEASNSFLKKVADAVETDFILPKFGFMEEKKTSNFFIYNLDSGHEREDCKNLKENYEVELTIF